MPLQIVFPGKALATNLAVCIQFGNVVGLSPLLVMNSVVSVDVFIFANRMLTGRIACLASDREIMLRHMFTN